MPVHSEAPILPRHPSYQCPYTARHPSRQCQARPDEPTSKARCGHAGTRARGHADLGGGQLVLQLLSVVHLCCHLLTLAVDFCRVLRTYLLAGEAMGRCMLASPVDGLEGRRGAAGIACPPQQALPALRQVCIRYAAGMRASCMRASAGRPCMRAPTSRSLLSITELGTSSPPARSSPPVGLAGGGAGARRGGVALRSRSSNFPLTCGQGPTCASASGPRARASGAWLACTCGASARCLRPPRAHAMWAHRPEPRSRR